MAMRALVCQEFGEASTMKLGELPIPVTGDDQVLIDVHAAGASYVDALMVRNKHQNKHVLPFAPGMPFAGHVRAIGCNTAGFSAGDRVMGLAYDGALAEIVAAPAREVFCIPDELKFEDAAALASAYLTPHAALRWEADLKEGDKLLVLGAAGTVGSAAIALGRAYGATVIAAASTAEKLEFARAAGANHCVNYSDEDLYESVQQLTDGNGVDVVFDPVGGDLYESAFRCLDWGGRYVVIGFAGGAIPQFAGNRLLVKNRKAIGFVLMYYRRKRPDLLRKTAEELSALVVAGKLNATPSNLIQLEDAGAAIDNFFYRRATGVTVVNVR